MCVCVCMCQHPGRGEKKVADGVTGEGGEVRERPGVQM